MAKSREPDLAELLALMLPKEQKQWDRNDLTGEQRGAILRTLRARFVAKSAGSADGGAGTSQRSTTLSALRDEVDRAGKTMEQAAELLRHRQPPAQPSKPWHKHRDLVVAIVGGCLAMAGAIVLWLVAPTSPAIVLIGLLVLFCLIAFSVSLVAHYFDRLRIGVLAGVLVSAILTAGLGWYVWPKPTPPQSDAVLSITDAVLPKETVIPFEAGKPIYVNLTIDNTGRNTAYKVREYGRMGFVSALSEKQEAEIEQLFAPVLDETKSPNAKPAYSIPPSLRAAPTITVYLASHSADDLENFNNDRKRLCVLLRLEYDDTKWTEACLILNRDQLDNMARGKQVMWSYCHSHNGSSRN